MRSVFRGSAFLLIGVLAVWAVGPRVTSAGDPNWRPSEDSTQPATADLTDDLRDPDAEVRYQAAAALAAMGPKAESAAPRLADALEDDSRWVRLEAAWALGKIGPGARSAVPQLLEAIWNKYPDVRYFAIRALGRIRADASEVVPALSGLLEDSEKEARTAAAMSLGDFGAQAVDTVECLMHMADNDRCDDARRFSEMAIDEIETAFNQQMARESAGLVGAWLGTYDLYGVPHLSGLEFTADGGVILISRNPYGFTLNTAGNYVYENGRLEVAIFGQAPVQPGIRWINSDRFVYTLGGLAITFDRTGGHITPERVLQEPLSGN